MAAAPGFTLEYNGLTQSLAAWKLSRPRRTLVSLEQSIFSVEAPVESINTAPIIPFEGDVRIYKDGTQFFVGKRLLASARGDGEREVNLYSFADPWYWLAQLPYEQTWKAGNKSRVMLCQDDDGSLITPGQQIRRILEYAISQGAPITIGDIEAGFETYFSEHVDIPCAEAIKICSAKNAAQPSPERSTSQATASTSRAVMTW